MSLLNAGFTPILVGRKLHESFEVNRPYKTKRFRLLFRKTFLFYAEFNLRLFFYLLFVKADIFLANDLDTLLPNYLIAHLREKKLVFDSHELFSEVPELIGRKRARKFWEYLESKYLPRIKYCYTVSQSVADYYNTRYGTSFKVVRNLPFRSEISSSEKKSDEISVIYQGALNVGRGIECAIRSMKFLTGFKLIIVGTGDIEDELHELCNKENLNSKVEFLGRMNLEALASVTASAHVGLSIEENKGLNYYYALPNKLFDYLQAGIPVIVSAFPEMKKIVEEYKVGSVLLEPSPVNLAKTIENVVSDKLYYEELCSNAKIAAEQLCWENEEKYLLEIIWSR